MGKGALEYDSYLTQLSSIQICSIFRNIHPVLYMTKRRKTTSVNARADFFFHESAEYFYTFYIYCQKIVKHPSFSPKWYFLYLYSTEQKSWAIPYFFIFLFIYLFIEKLDQTYSLLPFVWVNPQKRLMATLYDGHKINSIKYSRKDLTQDPTDTSGPQLIPLLFTETSLEMVSLEGHLKPCSRNGSNKKRLRYAKLHKNRYYNKNTTMTTNILPH